MIVNTALRFSRLRNLLTKEIGYSLKCRETSNIKQDDSDIHGRSCYLQRIWMLPEITPSVSETKLHARYIFVATQVPRRTKSVLEMHCA